MTTHNTATEPATPFDVDAFLASLPPPGCCPREDHYEDDNSRAQGSVGQRLSSSRSTTVSDSLLREIATETLGAVRCSSKYLDALRIVIGNQAHAERHGYLLELNTRTTFTTEKVMRTILAQMDAAGITFKKQVAFGRGRVQAMHCYRRGAPRRDYAEQLNEMCRRVEGAWHGPLPPLTIPPDEVPH